MVEKLLIKIGAQPFDGGVIHGKRRGKGSRRTFLLKVLRGAGLEPFEDPFGNVWVHSGKKGNVRVLSSHMDIDHCVSEVKPQIQKTNYSNLGECYEGILDNAVGCYLNLRLALENKSGQRILHVFTASEEVQPDGKASSLSARDALKTLKSMGVSPEFCVALDMTYPRLKVHQNKLLRLWDKHHHSILFDPHDCVHGYIDGITGKMSGPARKVARKFLKSYNSSKGSGPVKIRDFSCWDEAEIFSRVAPSFAFGPVGFGKYDEPNQVMPARNLETCWRFVRTLALA